MAATLLITLAPSDFPENWENYDVDASMEYLRYLLDVEAQELRNENINIGVFVGLPGESDVSMVYDLPEDGEDDALSVEAEVAFSRMMMAMFPFTSGNRRDWLISPSEEE